MNIMHKLLLISLLTPGLVYAACVGPYCYDDTGAYISNLHVSSITYKDGGIQGSVSSGGVSSSTPTIQTTGVITTTTTLTGGGAFLLDPTTAGIQITLPVASGVLGQFFIFNSSNTASHPMNIITTGSDKFFGSGNESNQSTNIPLSPATAISFMAIAVGKWIQII